MNQTRPVVEFFRAIVSCTVCGKKLGILGEANPIPGDQETVLAAANAAASKAFCEGHVRNANLRFEWQRVAAPAPRAATPAQAPAPAPAPVIDTKGVTVPEPSKTDEHGIPLDTLRALEEEEARKDAEALAAKQLAEQEASTAMALDVAMAVEDQANGIAHEVDQ